MSEKLKKILDDIGNASKTMKALRKKNAEVLCVTEQVRKRADEVEKLHLPNEPLLDELKQELKNVLDSGSKLEEWLEGFGKEIAEFDVNTFIIKKSRSEIPKEAFEAFCEMLRQAHETAEDFQKKFKSFIDHLSQSHSLAMKLKNSLEQKARRADWKAGAPRNLAIGAVGLAALGFFTGGVAWAIALGVAGGVGAAAAYKSIDVEGMRSLAEEIRNNSNNLGVIAQNLRSNCEMAEGIQLTGEEIKSLKAALEFFSNDLAKDDIIALQQKELDDKDAKIAEMEAKMRMHGIN